MERTENVPVTQYLRPHGEKRECKAPVTPEFKSLADRFVAAGGKYEAEVLTTGQVSLSAAFTVEGEMQDIAIEICPNNESIHTAFEKVIQASQRYVPISLTIS